jgi:hypothetical protein
MLRSSVLALSLLAAAGAHAQVYKCVDAAGRTVYTQDPCPAKTKTEPVSRNLDPAAPPPAPATSAGPAGAAAKGDAPKLTPDEAFRKRQEERAKAQKDEEQKLAQAKQKEQDCRNARDRATQYEIGGRISKIDDQGQRVYLDDAELERQRTQARADVAKACN